MINNNQINQLVTDFEKTLSEALILNFIIQDIKTQFYKGIDNVEIAFDRNILDVNPEVISFLQTYMFNNIKGMHTETANKLRTTLQRGLIEGKPQTQIVKEIQEIMDATKARAQMIARTELARAYSVGQLEAARASGLKAKKYVSIVNDNRTTELCKRLGKKYNKENAIDIDAKFYDDVTKESWLAPPFHVNCFLEGTMVKTQEGYKPIEKIEVGEMVYTHKNRLRKVTQTMKNVANEYYELEIESGLHNVPNIYVYVTGDHPILTSKGWLSVKMIKENDLILTYLGTLVKVKKITKIEKPAIVYNLSVDEDESYIAEGIIVHNCRSAVIITPVI